MAAAPTAAGDARDAAAMLDRQPTLSDAALLLRPLRAADWPALFAVAADPAIWAGHPAHDRWQEPVFRRFFDEALASGGCLVAVDRGDDALNDTLIGASRYDHGRAGAGEVEIGWTFLARSHWGGDWNRRMKRLMIGHALASVERAIFIVGEDNRRSRRAMAKIGGTLTGRSLMLPMPGGPVAHVVYAIDRAAFAAGPLARPD